MGVVIVVEGVEGVDGEYEGEPLGPLLLVLVVFAVSGVVDTERAVCDPVLGVVSIGGNLPGGDEVVECCMDSVVFCSCFCVKPRDSCKDCFASPTSHCRYSPFSHAIVTISESRSATILAISCVSSCVISSTLKNNISAEIRSPPVLLASSGSSEMASFLWFTWNQLCSLQGDAHRCRWRC